MPGQRLGLEDREVMQPTSRIVDFGPAVAAEIILLADLLVRLLDRSPAGR